MNKLWYFHTLWYDLATKNEQTVDAYNKMALIGLMLKEKSQCKKVHPVRSYFYKVLEQSKLTYGDWESDHSLPGVVEDLLQRGIRNFVGC